MEVEGEGKGHVNNLNAFEGKWNLTQSFSQGLDNKQILIIPS